MDFMVCPLETRIVDDQQRPLGGTTLVALGGEFHGTRHVIGHTGEALPVDQRGTGGSMEK